MSDNVTQINESSTNTINTGRSLTQAEVLQNLYSKSNSANTSISQIESILLTLVNQSNQDRISYYKLMQEFETYYLCTAIYEVLCDEILKDTGNDVIIKVTSEKYQELADKAMKEFNIEHLVESMLPKLLHYGDYTYRINKVYDGDDDPQGTITSISDDYYAGDVMGVYNNMVPIKYYELPQVRSIRNNRTMSGTILHEARELDIGDVLHFTLQSDNIKLELDDELRRKFSTPSLGVGIGVLWPQIDRLLILKLREISTTASDLSRLTRPTLIGADVPTNDSTDKIMNYCTQLESVLNNSSSDITNVSGDLITMITSAMSNGYKVIPKFQSGRGDASKLNLETQISDTGDDQKLRDERTLICSLAGIPPELVLNAAVEDRSSQRKYSRMNKKVKKIQRSIGRTIAQFMVNYVYTETGDMEVNELDFEVVLNSNTNIEDIDDAESLGYVLDNVKSLISAADDIKRSGIIGEDISPIDPKRFMDYLRSQFNSAGSDSSNVWLTDDEIQEVAKSRQSDSDYNSDADSHGDYVTDDGEVLDFNPKLPEDTNDYSDLLGDPDSLSSTDPDIDPEFNLDSPV